MKLEDDSIRVCDALFEEEMSMDDDTATTVGSIDTDVGSNDA